MNTKSLLLGSAAALFAVSGAYAADAVVVAEPEPMEYVRVCDVYGAGFYYIPGTETCLRVGGYLRYDIRAGDGGYGGFIDVNDKMGDGLNDTYFKRARAAVQLDARSETELGTLRSYIHLNFNWDSVRTPGNFTSTSTGVAINHAYIELGGFRIGKTDSLFSTFTGYAGGVIQDDLIAYGPFDTHQIAYTFTGGNGFSAAVALEEGSGVDTIDSYVPHVTGGVSYTQGWGGVSAVVGYDSNFEEWTGKVRLDVNATETVSLFIMGGYGSDDNVATNFYKTWGGNWAVWGGGSAQLAEKATLNVQVSYDEDENFAAVAGVNYRLVPGLTITPEIAYTDNFDLDNADGVGGFLRFQRNF
jgi:hypothetical protein